MGILDPRQISTQQHLDIEDIRNDLVVLKNGKVSVVIETTSLNFDLLAGQEQTSRISTFAGLLNSLNFPIQIVIRTQQTDTSKYLKLLEDYRQKIGAEGPLGQQVGMYQDFIGNLSNNTQILNKRFYAVIPSVNMPVLSRTNPLKVIFGREERIINIEELIEKATAELQPKRDHLIKQFANMGLQAHQMKNDELIKLYYSIYEPDKMGLDVLTVRQDNISGAVVGTNLRDSL